MKRIALISVHNEPNYGSVLQSYALAYAIRKEGYICEYLNYTPVPSPSSFKSKAKKLVKSLFHRLGLLDQSKSEYSFWQTEAFKKQWLLFSDFHEKRIPYSRTLYDPTTIAIANTYYDSFIVGSDQTWSPFVTQQRYNINFLEFVEQGKFKGAYAPSLGTCRLPEDYVKKLQDKLSDFRYLSCREKLNADTLTSYLGRKVEYVLDPTLLISSGEWSMISKPVDIPQSYILCYILGTKQCISDFADYLCRVQ